MRTLNFLVVLAMLATLGSVMAAPVGEHLRTSWSLINLTTFASMTT